MDHQYETVYGPGEYHAHYAVGMADGPDKRPVAAEPHGSKTTLSLELHGNRAGHLRIEVHDPQLDNTIHGGGGNEIGPSRSLDCVDARDLLLAVQSSRANTAERILLWTDMSSYCGNGAYVGSADVDGRTFLTFRQVHMKPAAVPKINTSLCSILDQASEVTGPRSLCPPAGDSILRPEGRSHNLTPSYPTKFCQQRSCCDNDWPYVPPLARTPAGETERAVIAPW